MTRVCLGVAAVLMALPLFPRLSPSWPNGWLPAAALLFAVIPLLTAIVHVLGRRRLDRRQLFLAGAFPLYALYTGNHAYHSSGDNLATVFVGPELVRHASLDLSRIFHRRD